MKAIFKSTVPPLLVLLFSYAAFSKLFTITAFDEQLHNQSFPGWLADFLLYFLIPAEIVTALLLCFKRTVMAGLLFSTVLMLAFTAYIALVLSGYFEKVPCSCGGVLKSLGWKPHLIFNLVFTALAITSLTIHLKQEVRDKE
ncbi:MauE/DoxX family redox-associated membrane protein [Pedobacter sp. GSP4]|uniref:MauE/DoxX family redox-associated membrane protein n=1 Tax=Pedobacter sp. GSP4 TaxID=3453716 RepID=UPI003EEF8CBA